MKACLAVLFSVALGLTAVFAATADLHVPRPRYDLLPRFDPAQSLVVEYADAQRRSPLASARIAATGDYDEDGTVDLVCAYSDAAGPFLLLHRGNVDSLFPQTSTSVAPPFLPSVTAVTLHQLPDYMEGGDFDADGHRDLVIATRGGGALHFLRGDGQGGFGAPSRVDLGGGVTTMVAGEIGRPDGLDDLAVGLTGADGSFVLLFAHRDGALLGQPKRHELPSSVSVLALGQLDEEPAIELIAAAGSELLLIAGNRRSSFEFRESIEAVAVADFVWDLEHRKEITILTRSGALYNTTLHDLDTTLPSVATRLGSSAIGGARRLLPLRASGRPADELLLLDGESRLTVLAHRPSGGALPWAPAWPTTIAKGFVELPAGSVAVYPARLNGDALNDLVVLGRDMAEPLTLLSAAATVFTVDSNHDENDVTRDGVCLTVLGECTLRAAIQEANFVAGADSITFALSAGSLTITPAWPLPAVSEAVTIDGTTQPGFAGTPIVELDGSSVGAGTTGLLLTGGNIAVRGLVIRDFTSDGVGMLGNGGNFIEGNFLGVDVTGTIGRPNEIMGVTTSTSGNTIGGTVAAARNIISGNEIYGVWIDSTASGNAVLGNYIGTDLSGTIALPNLIGGVLLTDTDLNAVGTPDPGGHNVISGNPVGVVVNSSTAGANLVQDNFIGTDFSGSAALPNAGNGVTLGGVGDTAVRNRIRNNLGNGVEISASAAVGNTIRSNAIFGNSGLGIDLGSPGVEANDIADPDAGANDLQNYPELAAAGTTSTLVAVAGSLNSTPAMDFIVEFFSSPLCDASGHGEGELPLGTTTVTTDLSGNTNFEASFAAAVPAGHSVTATATNPVRSTSDFSACLTVVDCQTLALVFGQTILAPNRDELSWPVAEDVAFVKGDLALVAGYAIGAQGLLTGATLLDISLDNPGPGAGLYYLVKRQQLCSGWQTTPGAEPARDGALP